MKKYTHYNYLFLFSVCVLLSGISVKNVHAQDLPQGSVEIITEEDVDAPNSDDLAELNEEEANVTDTSPSVETIQIETEETENVAQSEADQGDDTAVAEELAASEEQEASTSKQKLAAAKEKIRGKATKIPIAIDRMPSLFFTHYQYQAILSSKNKRGVVRPPTEAELAALNSGESLELDPERRYITLGGIVYRDEHDWTIWLNGKRVTPDAVPREVLDLVVYKNYIEVKWIDETTNQIFPLRMKAHQRFNMDMRIFLPG